MERIKHAACMRDGIVYVGKRHFNCIATMIECGLEAPIKMHEQGFITNTGRYVSREEALEIAKAAGQIIKKHNPQYQLLSEDIY